MRVTLTRLLNRDRDERFSFASGLWGQRLACRLTGGRRCTETLASGLAAHLLHNLLATARRAHASLVAPVGLTLS